MKGPDTVLCFPGCFFFFFLIVATFKKKNTKLCYILKCDLDYSVAEHPHENSYNFMAEVEEGSLAHFPNQTSEPASLEDSCLGKASTSVLGTSSPSCSPKASPGPPLCSTWSMPDQSF